ncbi:hypothetical protein ACWDA3_61080 [Nonomuraea rubra]
MPGPRLPERVVGISRLPLSAIEDLSDGGLRLGALARNAHVAADATQCSREPC